MPSIAIPKHVRKRSARTSALPSPDDIEIIDIRGASEEVTVKKTMLKMLAGGKYGELRRMPTMMLYDERGLQFFEAITHLDEYYLTNREISVFEKNAADMAAKVAPGTFLIELGSGNLRKIMILLDALESAGKDVEYFALDLSHDELRRTLAQLPIYKHVRSRGLWGTYEDGKRWMGREGVREMAKCVMHTGSTIGNFSPEDAAEFLRGFVDVMNESDTLMIGVDGCHDGTDVFNAYNDDWGISHEFISNSLNHINAALGEPVFTPSDWRLTGEFISDAAGSRHQYWMSPVGGAVSVMGTVIYPHERIIMEESWKYTESEARQLWDAAGLRQTAGWVDSQGEYGLYMVEKIRTPFSMRPEGYATEALPSFDEWKALWGLWDTVAGGMIPETALLSKPIDLRNACIFYLGHIPTFCDLQITRTMAMVPSPAKKFGALALATEPASYARIFERGIDPDVDDPEQCHAHSEIPDKWPDLDEILSYQTRVRERVEAIYNTCCKGQTVEEAVGRGVARGIWIAFEHEAMHLETLLFMLLQSEDTLPPPGIEVPDWETMARDVRRRRVANEWIRVPGAVLEVGLDDPENLTVTGGDFGWDIEKPMRKVGVPGFEIRGTPITNKEYATYMIENNITQKPASWASLTSVTELTAPKIPLQANGASLFAFSRTVGVRTVFGLVLLKFALDWPVAASYDELAACAVWMGGRIPTADEVNSAYAHAEAERRQKQEAGKVEQRMVPAVNAHLLHDGVEVTPPISPTSEAEEDKKRCEKKKTTRPFVAFDGRVREANIGFRHWHPVAVTGGDNHLGGRGDMGGVWEWTSTVMDRHKGYEPMGLYPGYSADFFDGKHNIILGGSWATVPRIAGRKTFINWFQRNYLYVWAGARVVRDINGPEILTSV